MSTNIKIILSTNSFNAKKMSHQTYRSVYLEELLSKLGILTFNLDKVSLRSMSTNIKINEP